MREPIRFSPAVLALALLPACGPAGDTQPDPAADPATPQAAATGIPPGTPSPTLPRPASFDLERALATIEALAGGIGPREATSDAFGEALDLVEGTFMALGYRPRRQEFPVPAGRSEGHPVPAGTSANLIAAPIGFEPSSPYLLAGAHLDTVPESPGANDNASGVAILLELARIARLDPPSLPILFVAFGGEERRLPGPEGNLFGSRFYVERMSEPARRGLAGMVSIDMVGAGDSVILCRGNLSPADLTHTFAREAEAMGIPTARCPQRVVQWSDHWPFEQAGFTVAWLWGGEHPTLHTPQDTPAVIQRVQLERIGQLAWATLRTYGA